MNMIRRGFHLFILFFFSNFHVFPFLSKSPPFLNPILVAVLGFYFIVFNITPRWKRNCFSHGGCLYSRVGKVGHLSRLL